MLAAAAPLGTFRAVFAGCMAYSMLQLIIGSDELEVKLSWASINFRWWFAPPWLLPRPSVGQAQALAASGVAAALIVAAGAPRRLYRPACLTLLVSYTSLLLVEKTRYNNHYLLDVLIIVALSVTDAQRSNIMVWFAEPVRRASAVPKWQLWLFRSQILLVYFCAGVAKLSSPDWLWRAQPMTGWLQGDQGAPFRPVARALLGAYNAVAGDTAAADTGLLLVGVDDMLGSAFSIGGLLFDLLVPLLLLASTELNHCGRSRGRWRVLCWALTLSFHLTNARTFTIGTFPLVMLTANVLFLVDATLPPHDKIGGAEASSQPGSSSVIGPGSNAVQESSRSSTCSSSFVTAPAAAAPAAPTAAAGGGGDVRAGQLDGECVCV